MKHRFLAYRVTALVLTAAMTVGLLGSCKTFNKTEPATPAGSLILGQKLTLSPVNNDKAIALVDDSGMSGLEANNHLCGTDTADMYTFTAGETVVFSLSRAEALGQLYVWNYNDPAALNCGVKEMNVQYSLDGATWTDFGVVTLAMSSSEEDEKHGGCVAANYGAPIDLGGVSAKFIALTPTSNHGGSSMGLSEVRVFRHKIRPGDGQMITGKVITTVVGTTPEAAFNNQGMSDRDSKTATHNNVSSDMWLSNESVEQSYYVMSMDGTYPIKEIALWNYNDAANLGAGVKEFKVFYTVEAPCSIDFEESADGKYNVDETFDFSKGDWKPLTVDGKDVFTLPQGDGSEAMAASLTLTLDEVVQAQHLKIVPVNTYGGNGVGLSEIRVFAGKGWGVEPAREWTGVLSSSGTFDYQGEAYNRNGGWVGADGVHAYTLNGTQQQGSLSDDSKTFVLFQDTVVANMNNYKGWTSYGGYKASHSGWVNMSYLFIEGDEPDVRKVQFVLQGKDSDQHPYNNICAKHYWMADITLINGVLYNAACKYEGWDTPEGAEGYDLVAITLGDDLFPDMNVVPQVVSDQIPDFAQGPIFENTEEAGAPDPDGYIYVYGKNKQGLWQVARCLPEDYAKPNYDKWEFYGGEKKGWIVGNSEEAFKGVQSKISTYASGNESNIVYSAAGPFAQKYVNLYTQGSIGGQIKLGASNSLVGKFAGPDSTEDKFTDPISVFWAPEKYEYILERGYDAMSQWNYNAKIQVNLSKSDELLFTYHIGTQKTRDQAGTEYVHPIFYNMFEIY